MSVTDSGPSASPAVDILASEDLASLTSQLVEQRRQTTLLQAELYERNEAYELMQVQLEQAKSESLASRNRRKEMARIIGLRDARIKELTEELQARYAELGILQRQMVGPRFTRLFKGLFARR
jgi:hypothetical protein